MNKTRYIRSSSGSMLPIYPHPTDKKDSLESKASRPKIPKTVEIAKTSNRKS